MESKKVQIANLVISIPSDLQVEKGSSRATDYDGDYLTALHRAQAADPNAAYNYDLYHPTHSQQTEKPYDVYVVSWGTHFLSFSLKSGPVKVSQNICISNFKESDLEDDSGYWKSLNAGSVKWLISMNGVVLEFSFFGIGIPNLKIKNDVKEIIGGIKGF